MQANLELDGCLFTMIWSGSAYKKNKTIGLGRQKMLWRYTEYIGHILEDLGYIYDNLYTSQCDENSSITSSFTSRPHIGLVATYKPCLDAWRVSCSQFSERIAWNFHSIPVADVLWLWDKRNYCLQVLMTGQFNQVFTWTQPCPDFGLLFYVSLNLCNPHRSLTSCQWRLPCWLETGCFCCKPELQTFTSRSPRVKWGAVSSFWTVHLVTSLCYAWREHWLQAIKL